MRHARARIGTVALTAMALAFSTPAVQAQGSGYTHYQTTNLIDFATGASVGGAATLYRSQNGVSLRISASDLDHATAYTVWWIVWNDPPLFRPVWRGRSRHRHELYLLRHWVRD